MAQPPSVPNRDGGSRWLLACGVGCGALLLIVVLGIIATTAAIRYGMGEATSGMRAGFASEYAQLQEDEKIPVEHAEVFDRIFVVSQRDDASFMTTTMGFLVVIGYLEDGEVTETEAESAVTLADYLEANPDMGIREFGRFVEEHPEFQDAFQDAQRSMERLQRESFEEPEEEPIVEDTETL